ncbi:WXG100 family type VII secretion target [Pseudactinotalea sp. HY158]|uniref:WXG100 family type VII secretion target n=1 Tax=Pseudactinotalea sp. HY158 TaxID=2654547 RepID=UPI0018927F00|nr:hypothetical protein [Pseudactinotalea sp. HY158]
MNDLVAIESDDFTHFSNWTDLDLALGNVPMVGDAFSAGQEFGAGDWAEGLAYLALAGVGVAEWMVDPFGTLLSSAAAMLMDYMPPLPQLLDSVAGNPALVEGIAQTWSNISERLFQEADELLTALQTVLADWSGAAADAYAERVQLLVALIQGLGAGASGLAGGFAVASAIVTVVRTIVKELIADLVGRLIAYMIEVGATLGVALPVVIGQAITAIGTTTLQVTRKIDDLAAAARTGQTVAERVIEAISQIKAAVEALRSGVEQGAGALEGN